jgi:hypothetical protein
MSIPVALRGDFKASQLRALARKTKDGPQARRLLALAAIYDGTTRIEAAKIGGVTARSGPWRPGFPVDGDQHFQSMTTTCSG